MANDASERVWTVLEILNWTTEFLGTRGVESPRLDAELMLAQVLALPRIQLYVQFNRPLQADERDAFRAMVKRRARREPVQYILGNQEFWSLELKVGPGVLIPRGDTEVLVEEVLKEAPAAPTQSAPEGDDASEGQGAKPWRVAEVGTGSGAIALALASERPQAEIWAGDIADAPLQTAAANAVSLGLSERVHILQADGILPLWDAAGRQPFDAIVSNPPYIPTGDGPGLMPEVRDFEPPGALFSGVDGLDLIRRLIAEAATPGVLAAGGCLAFEIGDDTQANVLAGWLREGGFENSRIRKDYAGTARVVVGIKRHV